MNRRKIDYVKKIESKGGDVNPVRRSSVEKCEDVRCRFMKYLLRVCAIKFL